MPAPQLLAALVLGVQAQLIAPLPRVPLPRPHPDAPVAVANTNRVPAGTLAGKVLTLRLDVVNAAWRPEGDDAPAVPVFAFVEPGRAPSVPGPLVRVPQGTEVRLVLRSRVDSALVVGGLRPRTRLAAGALDTVTLAAGATRELRYRLDGPGTYFYWAAFPGRNFGTQQWLDSQLNGAIVVDPPGAATDDRVMVLSEWFHPYPGGRQPFEVVTVINGKAWPHTERVELTQGDSARFRVLNATGLHHPMHLHGFFFRVLARGTWDADGPIAPALRPMLNTDLMAPGGTLTLAFRATTPGNWLFHCHFSFHMDHTVSLVGSPRDSAEAAVLAAKPDARGGDAHGHDAHAPPRGAGPGHAEHMRGLVVGIQVKPGPGWRPYDAPDARALRLVAQRRPGRLIGGTDAYGFVLQRGDAAPAPDSVVLPGPVLELRRGEPVRVTVVNNLAEPTGVHWHGLEIESFPDGVAGWSGMGDRLMPAIAPGDSFVAEFTPPRAGTYPYHSHLNERHQILSGMYGAIVVADGPRDPARDHLIVAGGGGPAVWSKTESPFALVNGRYAPRPLRLAAGETHRLRLVSVHPDWRVAFTLRDDSTVARWRALAKDGHDLPAAQATTRPAHVEMGPGETADFEFRPRAPGVWRMEVRSVESGFYVPLEVIVTAPTARPR